MLNPLIRITVAGALAFISIPAKATDRPISAASLVIRRLASGRETLKFTSRDPNLLFPAIGSADDPANGNPGAVLVELFSQSESSGASFLIPPGVGNPGWKVTDAKTDQYRFLNRQAPLGLSPAKSATIRQGKLLTVTAATTGLGLDGPQGRIGIRITTGALRNCALFDGATIKKDRAGWFVGRHAAASALADCSMHLSPFARPADPVVLTGNDVAQLIGISPNDLVAFRYDAGWVQVPVQVDERAIVSLDNVYNHVGAYGGGITVPAYTDATTFTGGDPDPTLDADDEIAFMAVDTGDQTPGVVGEPAGVIHGSGVEVRISDPLDAAVGYVYLFRQAGSLEPGAGQHYVDYQFDLLSGDYRSTYKINAGPNPEDTSISSSFYAAHFADRWIQDEAHIFTGGATGVDILDRHKNLFAPGNCVRSEDTFSGGEGAFVMNKNGPVRSIRSYVGANSGPRTQRDHIFYQRRQDIRTFLRVHSIPGMMDFFDYSPAAAGMTYRNNLNLAGVTIDGVPESVATVAPAWEMVSGPQGSLVMVGAVNTTITGLVPTLYYLDSATPPVTQCTGDAFAYGSSGLWINQTIPNTDPIYAGFQTLQGTRIIYYDAPDITVSDAEQRYRWTATPLAVTASNWP